MEQKIADVNSAADEGMRKLEISLKENIEEEKQSILA